MKIYVPILLAQGTYTYEVPDGFNVNEALNHIKENNLGPVHCRIDTCKPNFDAARLTPEIHRNYDKGN